MLTKPIAIRLYEKLANAPKGWFKTNEGRRLVAKSIRHVRKLEGREEADLLRNMLTALEAAQLAQGFEK